MEAIVRPFETIDITPRKVVGASSKQATQNITLRYGGGSGKTVTCSHTVEIKNYIDRTVREQKDEFAL